MILIDMKTGRGLNSVETWRKRATRVKTEKHLVGWSLRTIERFEVPCVVLITRVAPGNGLDDDNLAGSMKAVRDAVAEWVCVDDGHPSVLYRYMQRRGPWGVEIKRTTRGEELIRLQALLGAGVMS